MALGGIVEDRMAGTVLCECGAESKTVDADGMKCQAGHFTPTGTGNVKPVSVNARSRKGQEPLATAGLATMLAFQQETDKRFAAALDGMTACLDRLNRTIDATGMVIDANTRVVEALVEKLEAMPSSLAWNGDDEGEEPPEPEEPDIPDYGPHAGAVVREFEDDGVPW